MTYMVTTNDFGKGGGGKKDDEVVEEATATETSKPAKKTAKKRTPAKKKAEVAPSSEKTADVVIGDGQMTLKMRTGSSYTTGNGVRFTREHPYQIVMLSDGGQLIQSERFSIATKEEVKEFYL